MTQSANLAAIETATQTSWPEWLQYLEGIKAKDLPHKAIADQVRTKLQTAHTTGESSGWWAQAVTVAYEQHIGRRAPGQRSDGSYEVAVSKTFDTSTDQAMEVWLHWVQDKTAFATVAIAGPPTTTQANKRRHWACNLEDGTRVNADVYPKTDDKVILAITHSKLANPQTLERWRAHWKSILEPLQPPT